MKALLALLAALAATAHAETRPHYGGTVEATLLGALSTLDPALVQLARRGDRRSLLFDTLYRIGPDGVAVPHIAAAMPVLDRGSHDRAHPDPQGHPAPGRQRAHAAGRRRVARSRAHERRCEVGPRVGEVGQRRSRCGRASSCTGDPARAADELATLLALPQTAITKGGRASGKVIGIGPVPDRVARCAAPPARAQGVRRSLRGPAVHRRARAALVRHARRRGAPVRDRQRAAVGARRRGIRGRAADVRAEDVEGPAALLVYVGFGRAASRRARRPRVSPCARRRARARRRSPASARESASCRAGCRCRSRPVRRRWSRARGEVAAATALLARSEHRDPRAGAAVEPDARDPRRGRRAPTIARSPSACSRVSTSSASTRRSPRCRRQVLRDRIAAGQVRPVDRSARRAGHRAGRVVGRRRSRAGGDDTLVQARQAFDSAAAAKAFAERLPIVPLMFRSVRMWHRTDVRGLSFDASGRPSFADLFLFGDAGADARPAMKLRGRFTLTLALAALVPIAVAAVVTTAGDRRVVARGLRCDAHPDAGGHRPRGQAARGAGRRGRRRR